MIKFLKTYTRLGEKKVMYFPGETAEFDAKTEKRLIDVKYAEKIKKQS